MSFFILNHVQNDRQITFYLVHIFCLLGFSPVVNINFTNISFWNLGSNSE